LGWDHKLARSSYLFTPLRKRKKFVLSLIVNLLLLQMLLSTMYRNNTIEGKCEDDTNLEITPNDWWDSNWQYCTRIDIGNNDNDLLNYQFLVAFSSSTFDYYKCQNDGDDIRFVDKSNLTEFSYWIEKWNPTGLSRIWVKMSYIKGHDNTTIFMYYGNPSVSGSSNGDATFVFYTDYSRIYRWHVFGLDLQLTIEGTDLHFVQNPAVGDYADVPCVCNLSKYIYEERIMVKNDVVGNSHLFFAFMDHTDTALWGGFRRVHDNEDATFSQTPTLNNLLYDGYSHDLYYNRREIVDDVTKQASYYYYNDYFNGAPLASALNKPFIHNDLDTLERIMIFTGTGSSRDYEFYLTWMRIRKYASVEPTIIFGAEALPPNPDHSISTPTEPIPRNIIILISVVGAGLLIVMIGAIVFTKKIE